MTASEHTAPLDGYTLYDAADPFEMRAGPFYWRALLDGTHHFVLRTEERHCNAHGIVHGGVMMTMADLAICAAAKEDRAREFVVTVSMNADFVAAGERGALLEAKAEVTRRTGTLAFVRTQVSAGARVLLNCNAVVRRISKDRR